jgi:hypothetical protein
MSEFLKHAQDNKEPGVGTHPSASTKWDNEEYLKGKIKYMLVSKGHLFTNYL